MVPLSVPFALFYICCYVRVLLKDEIDLWVFRRFKIAHLLNTYAEGAGEGIS